MAKENISIKFLIHLVGERPALWDKTSEDYKDRKLKETSWREICAFVNENFYSLPNRARNEFYKMIMKKWTHIRDSWVKSMKYGYDEVTKLPPKPYVYHNELKFLQKILKCKPHRFDLNQCHPSNTHFEEFFRETNETQNSRVNPQDMEDNEVDEEKQTDIDFKQEPTTNTNQTKLTEAEESDEWQLEEPEIAPEIEAVEEKDTKAELTKKKRKSIFVSARNDEDDYIEQKASPRIVLEQPPKTPPMSLTIPAQTRPQISRIERASSYQQKIDHNSSERHWNFFKGILPSINGLDEDHILQFQSGVISLLQKLRESQSNKMKPKPNRLSSHSLFKGRGRKRKASLQEDDDWAPSNNFVSKKSNRQTFDPIAPECEESATEYSSND